MTLTHTVNMTDRLPDILTHNRVLLPHSDQPGKCGANTGRLAARRHQGHGLICPVGISAPGGMASKCAFPQLNGHRHGARPFGVV